MHTTFSRAELVGLAVCIGLIGVAVLAPALAQPANPHDFADRRFLAGIPFAMDVLSNLFFAAAGLCGMWLLHQIPRQSLGKTQYALAVLFFAGLVVTAGGSAIYHLRPDDAGLAVDRLAMSLVFAGVLGLAAAGRVSDRAGIALALAGAVAGPVAVLAWLAQDNILPWALFQFGGMTLVAALVVMRRRYGALAINWFMVIGAYGVAKLLEINDHEIQTLTGHLVSGHTLKHVVAALAAYPVLIAVAKLRQSRQNAAVPTVELLATAAWARHK